LGAQIELTGATVTKRPAAVTLDHIELPYVRDPNLDTPLARSALPMLLKLRKLLEG